MTVVMRRTVIVQGGLAFATRRAAAARDGENGLQIMTTTQLASRLAGGFLHQVTGEELEFVVASALHAGGFEDIETVRHLPGMTRAVARTLRVAWNADIRLAHAPDGNVRIRDLARLENRVRGFLAGGARLPTDLRDEARARMQWAPSVLGPVTIMGVHYIEPVWRPLIHDFCAMAPVVWTAPAPDMDPAHARLELAKRYLHIFGPATAASFARWAGIGGGEAKSAFAALADTLAPASRPIGDAWILASDEEWFRARPRPAAPVRLLPSGDAYYLLWGADREILVPDAKRRGELWTTRVWPGALLVKGEVVGTWRRSASDVSIDVWRRLSPSEQEVVEAEAISLPLGLMSLMTVRWR